MAAYQNSLDELEQLGITVIGATVEDRETAAGMAEEEGLTFPIAYGVTADALAALAPSWAENEYVGRFLQPMEFLVVNGIVAGSIYASGPIGRMDVAQAATYIRERHYTFEVKAVSPS